MVVSTRCGFKPAVALNRYLPPIVIVSAGVLGWQLALMRYLLITRYYHFSFLIISCALLGYGIGGAILSRFRQWFDNHGEVFFRWACLAFGVSMPLCFRLAESLPLSVFFPPDDLFLSIFWWTIYWVIQSCPFVLAGALTGWALSGNVRPINFVYACSLIGASLGVVGAMFFLSRYPPHGLIIPLGLVVIAGCLGLLPRQPFRARFVYGLFLGLSSVIMGIGLFVDVDKVFPLRVDQYKNLAHIQRLTAQNSAQQIQIFNGLRGRVELYTSPHFHALLSLASAKTISPMDVILKDGIQIGTIPVVNNDNQAAFLDDALFTLPYSLSNPQQILILGEAGAVHLWAARLYRPSRIVLVQPDEHVIKILQSHPGRPLDAPNIRVHIGDTRAFLDKTKEKFDVIQLAELDGFVPGTSGIGGLRENYLATVEGFQKCMNALTPGGVACTVRGIQDPPRDNVKIIATWFEALKANHSLDPSSHILVARDELSCAVLCWRSPVAPEVARNFAALCDEKSWEQEWAPNIKPDLTNRLHVLPGPSDSSVSWYHEAISKFKADQGEQFYLDWISHIRPATDNKPYFFDFFRMASISVLKHQFGPLWAARSEMGFLVLLVCLVATFVAAAVFLVTALVGTSKRSGQSLGGGLFWVLSFFAMIGTAFMFVEILLIQTFTRVFGDPVIAVGVVLGGLLLFSGLGSILQPFITRESSIAMLAVGLMCGATLYLTHSVLSRLQPFVAGLDLSHAIVLSVAIIGPIGVLMGVPFPWAMSKIVRKKLTVAPFGWTVNCFASVISSPLAIVASMSLGFGFLWATGSLLYIFVGLLGSLEGWMLYYAPEEKVVKLKK